MSLTFGSFFSGAGGMDHAMHIAGMTPLWQAEIDRNANKVLAKHYPNVERFMDVRDVNAANAIRPDVITGGWPCQGNSVAGKRAGLADERSGLWGEVKRILGEITPQWFLGENVPGILSVNGGRDWLAVLRDLAELGYGFAYRVLDAQFFGVAQRRRRVFIVGCLGSWRRAAKVLFESDCLPWHPAPRREKRQDVARCIARGTSSSGYRYDANGEDFVIAYRTSGNSGVMEQGDKTAALNTFTDKTQQIIAFQTRIARNGRGQPKEIADALTGGGEGLHSDSMPHITVVNGIRRLTPLECLRLQGLPDDWLDDCGLSDSAKYRLIGNSVAVPCVRWIGQRIIEAAK